LTDRRKLKAESTEEIIVVSDPGSLGCHLSSAVCHLVFFCLLSSVIRPQVFHHPSSLSVSIRGNNVFLSSEIGLLISEASVPKKSLPCFYPIRTH